MNNRLWVTACLAIAGALAQAQDMGKHITFTAPATRASVLLPQLSKEIGVQLLTVAQTENEVLLVQVHDVSVQDVLDHIAKAANAEWKKEGRVYRLVRPSGLSTKASVREAEQRTAMFQKLLDQQNADLKKLPAWSADQAQVLAKAMMAALSEASPPGPRTRENQIELHKTASQMPAAVATSMLVDQIGAKDLAAIGPNERVVYALHPTAMQLQLGGESASIIEQLVREQQQYADAFKGLGPAPRTRYTVSVQQLGEVPTLNPGNPALGVGQAILVLTPVTFGQMSGSAITFSARLTVADTAGETLVSGTHFFSDQRQFLETQEPAERSNPIALSPLAREFAAVAQIPPFLPASDEMTTMRSRLKGFSEPLNFTSRLDRGAPNRQLSPELKSKMLQPETYDPTSLFAGEALSASATMLHKNLVADLPDTCVLQLARLFQNSNSNIGAEDLFRIECPMADLDSQQSSDWIVVTPAKRMDAELHRVNRVALGKLLRSLDRQTSLNLDDLAGFALSQAKPVGDSDVDGLYLQVAGGTLGRKALSTLHNADTLRIYGTLTPAQRSAMESNNTISFDMLTSDQKRWLADDVFNSADGPQDGSPMDGPPPAGARRNTVNGPGYSTIKDERTQVLPDGIRASGQVVFQFASDRGLFGYSQEYHTAGFLSPTDMAVRMYQKERPQLGTPTVYDSYQPAKRANITFKFQLAPTATLSRSLENITVDSSGKALAFADLPDDTRRQVLDLLDQIRHSQLANIQFSGNTYSFGGKPPPPLAP